MNTSGYNYFAYIYSQNCLRAQYESFKNTQDMKKLIVCVVISVIAITVSSQPPQAFKYQAVVRDNSGQILQNQAIGVRISIHHGTAGGPIVYQELFSVSTNEFGLINLDIGTGTPTGYPFTNISWSSGNKFLQLEIDPSGGTSYITMGTSQLLSVPYAMYAGEATVAEDGDWTTSGDDLYSANSGNVGIGTSSPFYKLDVSSGSGTAIGALSLDSYTIIGQTNGSGVAGVLGRGEASDSWGVYGYCPNGGTAIRGYSNGGWAGYLNGDTYIAGNLGIGSMNPSERLEVSGSMLISGGFKGIRMRTNGTMVDIESQFTDLALNYQTGHNTVMNVVSGEVGIGTSTPDAKLHVKDRIRIGEDPGYSTVYGEIYHEGGGNGFILNSNAGGGSWADMYLQTNGNTKLFIESAGKVGIGTTNPIARLTVNGSGGEMGVYAGSISGTGLNASSGTGYGLFAVSQGWAGWFSGNVKVTGSLSKGSGSFVIDHPLDPENKLLRHNFVESPENLLIYRGKVQLDNSGEASVILPDYFKALTMENEATIQLTPVGRSKAERYYELSYEWMNSFDQFLIYGEPGREISWMVLADRDDPVIHELGRPVEEEKGDMNPICEKGKLLYPEAYGYPETKGRDYVIRQKAIPENH